MDTWQVEDILDGIAEPIVVIGLNHRVRLMNRAAHEIFKGGQESCYHLFHRRDTLCDGKEWPCPVKIVLETGRSATVEHEHFTSLGEGRYYEILASPLRDKGGAITAIIQTVRDITSRRKAEERARVAEQEKKDFYAMVVHDLRSSLTSISGYTSLILKRENISRDDILGMLEVIHLMPRE